LKPLGLIEEKKEEKKKEAPKEAAPKAEEKPAKVLDNYDIYEGEGAKEHITKNLLGGFLNRAEHTNKYTFGRMCVLGDEPNL